MPISEVGIIPAAGNDAVQQMNVMPCNAGR